MIELAPPYFIYEASQRNEAGKKKLKFPVQILGLVHPLKLQPM